jgi:hypothetical protein
VRLHFISGLLLCLGFYLDRVWVRRWGDGEMGNE